MPKRPINISRWLGLWQKYSEFRKPQLRYSTFVRDYQKIERRLLKLKKRAPHLRSAVEIRDHLLRNYAAETTRRTLQQLQACGRWAVESELVKENPWEGLSRRIRQVEPGPDNWAAFTQEERNRIILAFEESNVQHANWVRFLFWTGCRPEEAAALRWEHIAADYSEIHFCEARPIDVGVTQRTKTGKSTRFPCNARLAGLLNTLAPSVPNRAEWVLKGAKGGPFDYKNFQERHWKPTVNGLVESGEVAFYLSQYHCRHTWITLALEHLPPQDVAYLARVSVRVIYEHYVGRNRKITIPEF